MTDPHPYQLKLYASNPIPTPPLPDFSPQESYLVLLPGDRLLQASFSLSQPNDPSLTELAGDRDVKALMMDTIAALLRLAAAGHDIPDKAQYLGLPHGAVLHCYKKPWPFASGWDWQLHGRALRPVEWKLKFALARA